MRQGGCQSCPPGEAVWGDRCEPTTCESQRACEVRVPTHVRALTPSSARAHALHPQAGEQCVPETPACATTGATPCKMFACRAAEKIKGGVNTVESSASRREAIGVWALGLLLGPLVHT